MPKRAISLRQFVLRRNGVPLGGSGALREMLKRSLGAKSITVFWQYWNPIFGYYLGKLVFRPLRSLGLPAALAVIITFCVSGAVHDLAASAVTRQVIFVCTPWFFFMALGLIVSQRFGMDMSALKPVTRGAVHLLYIATCAALALYLRAAFTG